MIVTKLRFGKNCR